MGKRPGRVLRRRQGRGIECVSGANIRCKRIERLLAWCDRQLVTRIARDVSYMAGHKRLLGR